jgi:hypothetical protein
MCVKQKLVKKVTITVNSDDFELFKCNCRKKGYKISTRIALFIRDDLERNGLVKKKKIGN